MWHCPTLLGNVNSDLGNLEQAKEYYERALTILLKNYGGCVLSPT